MLRKKISFLSFYLNIVCKNIVCDVGLIRNFKIRINWSEFIQAKHNTNQKITDDLG